MNEKKQCMTTQREASLCRCCGAALAAKRLLTLVGMPGGAQNFPDMAGLALDTPVDLELVQCTACGLVQLTGEPVDYWRSVIRAVGVSKDMLAFRQEQIKAFVSRHKLTGCPAMEFGSGDGAFLSVLMEAGLEAYGLEYAQDEVNRCIQKGLRAYQGFALPGAPVPGGPYDAFFIFSVLEHVPVPRDFLASVRESLSDKAVGIIEVPNFDMILQKGLFAEFIIDHLFYFTSETLTRTLENNGFDVLSCAPVWHDYILSAEVRKRSHITPTHFMARKAEVIQAFAHFFAQHKRVAVWGAGHQAFTLLAMVPDTNPIAYIVDSAPFKQGRYSPVTHIPVVHPEKLLSDPVRALIVIGGSYSEEIAEIASNQYKQNNIAIFSGASLVRIREGLPSGS
ncbi:class I SAM-dependent methyltransferase [Desulfovibrio sp. OttesenSCG-928-M16]|nr:class I SAM-dependent methyltransferase [Desulfovibrio sp. OttesenSCG-928-M16]